MRPGAQRPMVCCRRILPLIYSEDSALTAVDADLSGPEVRRFGTSSFMGLAGVMHPDWVVELLMLLAIANGAPVVVKRLLGDVFAYPLDGGKRFLDGRPLFGSSKTIRGVATSIVATAGLAPLWGTTFTTGLLVGAGAMAGDLLSSFVKRRMDYPSSSRALGIDQIPESLLPAVLSKGLLGLSPVDIALVVSLFFVGEIVLSRILFKLHVREQPY